jgi:hypothetical protein
VGHIGRLRKNYQFWVSFTVIAGSVNLERVQRVDLHPGGDDVAARARPDVFGAKVSGDPASEPDSMEM